MSRWRLKTVLHLPGPIVLTRTSGCRRRRFRGIGVPRIAGSGREAVSGFIALFLLGWLVSWKWRTRNQPRKSRKWVIYVAIWLAVALVAAVIL